MMFILEIKNQEMTRDLLFAIHKMVTDGTLGNPAGAGRFREPGEDIVVGDVGGEVFHAPPPAQDVERRIDEMCKFANGVTPGGFIHPMVRSMILHFWLAYDHPFVDGNGRTARALFYWSMLRQGYWLFEYISISNIILKAPVQYGRAFLYTETDQNDLTYFLIYHAGVIRKAIDELYAAHRTSNQAVVRGPEETPRTHDSQLSTARVDWPRLATPGAPIHDRVTSQ